MAFRLCLTALLVLALPLSAYSGASSGSELEMAPGSALTQEVRAAPSEVQEAYRFALANPEVLRKIPCYCSCETWEHESNYDCYVEEVRPDGSVELSHHGLG